MIIIILISLLIDFRWNQMEKQINDLPLDKDNTDNVWDATETGSLLGVKYFLAQDPSNLEKQDEDYYTCRPLHYASQNGHLHIVQHLLSKRAEIDPLDSDEDTPLIEACQYGHLSIVNFLLDKGSNINHRSINMDTPLHRVVRVNKLDVVKGLIERGGR